LTSSTDENGQKTSYSYDDPLRRITETDLPDGGQTSLSYNDSGTSPSIVTTKKIAPGINSISTAVMDGMGHVTQTQFNSDPAGVAFTDIVYDGMSRVMSSSNPHRNAALPTDGITRLQYDPLGRVTQVTKQDGGVSTVSYTGNCTLSIDEAGTRRRACNDALGRRVEVDEPTPGVSEAINATSATATVGFSGFLQSKQLTNPATGTVFISGTDSIVPVSYTH
jgi:YD repeat-containing protein